MTAYSDKQYVELFHLLFLAQLGSKVDKRFYALKGGCNLRFFLKSPRFSEDMDLDTKGISVDRLKERVGAILKSKPFADVLKAKGIHIVHINDDKQTATTQRWKLGLGVSNIERPLPTKIEFSHRDMGEDVRFEPIDPLIIGGYQLSSILTMHYPPHIAYQQKLSALVNRIATQARDIFDLHLLVMSGVKTDELPKQLREKLAVAKERIMATDYSEFTGQVLAYLPPDNQAMYDANMWDDMRLRVVETLE